MTAASAILVTRGDVDLQPIIDSLPVSWEVVIWDNGARSIQRSDGWAEVCSDLSVYGRYAAIEYATHPICYVQDDDCIVSDPEAIVREYVLQCARQDHVGHWPGVVCNLPPEFRPHYPDSALVGFGAAFHRDAPKRVFERFFGEMPNISLGVSAAFQEPGHAYRDWFNRECDRVFTVLTPRVLVDVPKQDCTYASDPNRMWRSADHIGERDRMIALARQVRDA